MLSRMGWSLSVVGMVFSSGALLAGEPYEQFLNALQSEGYGRLAVLYLDNIAKKPDLPKSLIDTMDLERSQSIKASANEAYNAQQKTALLAEAKTLLQKFLTANPKHPAALEVRLDEGNDLLLSGQVKMAMMRGAKDKAEGDKLRDEAKGNFTQAKTNFEQAQAAVKVRLTEIPVGDPNKPSKERAETEDIELDGRFKLALTDFFLSQTFVDAKEAADKKKALTSAYKQFDAIYQENRVASNRAAHMAHMWQGRCLEEQGDANSIASALDCYDEVLVVSPEGVNLDVDLAPLFGQAALFRLRLLGKKKDVKLPEVIGEAREWLITHKGWQNTDQFQGMAIELVKAQFAYASSLVGPNQKKLLTETLTLATGITKVDTEYKHEAILLQRQIKAKLGRGEGSVANYDELMLDGDGAFNDKRWADASEAYGDAIEAAKKLNDPKKIDLVTSRLNQVRFQLALEKYQENKYEETVQAVGEIVRPVAGDLAALTKDPVYLKASNLAVSCALELFSAAPDEAGKAAAFTRMDALASFVIKNWPGKPEADDARMMMAQGYLGKNDYKEAIARLYQVNSESPRYGGASRIAGQIYWRQYWEGKRGNPPAEADALLKLRDTAYTRFKTSYDFQMKDPPKLEATERMPNILFETQLYLAEVLMESEKPAEAAKLFLPLVDDIAKVKPEEIDVVTLRTFIGAVRSNIAVGDIEKAGNSAVKLMDISKDAEDVNKVLIDFTRLMVGEMLRSETAVIEAEAKAPTEVPAKKASFEAVKGVVAKMAEKLSERVLSLSGMLFLGDTCAKVNMNEKAKEVYLKILAQVDDPQNQAAKEQLGKATTRIRTQIVSLLRNEGKFDEAVKQADALIKDHPTALEPLMEKGRILQAWSKTDPSKYDDCVGHWTKIRVLLGNQKTRTNDYYEVLLNVAECLLAQSRALKQQKKDSESEARALDAEKMLKSTLTLTPKLSGPVMVARFNAVIATAIKLQGRNPNAPTTPTKAPEKKDSGKK